jgi:ribosomal protein S27AE
VSLVRRRELAGDDLRAQVRRRLRDIDTDIERLREERRVLKDRLRRLERDARQGVDRRKARTVEPAKDRGNAAMCPRCGRDRDFLTDADGYLAHVLEEPGDTELLAEGKPLFCPACGEVFLWKVPAAE